MTSPASEVRSERDLSSIETRPLLLVGLVPSAPIDEATEATSGSETIASSAARCRVDIRWKEASAGATEKPTTRPVSCKGKNPLGIASARRAVTMSVARVIASVPGWCDRTHFRVRS